MYDRQPFAMANDGRVAYAYLSRHIASRTPSANLAANVGDLFRGKSVWANPSTAASFECFVALVVRLSTKPQVSRVEAGRIVATVKNAQRRVQIKPHPYEGRYPMDKHWSWWLPSRHRSLPVAFRVQRSRPEPAPVSVDLAVCKQPLSQYFSSVQVSPPARLTVTRRIIAGAPAAVGFGDSFSLPAGATSWL